MTKDEGVFIDTNILVYAAQGGDVRHVACEGFLRATGGPLLHISPQILSEFYSTITNPKRVTKPLMPSETIQFMEVLLGYPHVTLLPVSRQVTEHWLVLLKQTELRGPRIFDLQIAATMLVHGIKKIATYNGQDFQAISEIESFEPQSPSYLQ